MPPTTFIPHGHGLLGGPSLGGPGASQFPLGPMQGGPTFSQPPLQVLNKYVNLL
jgi:hypothetical protein